MACNLHPMEFEGSWTLVAWRRISHDGNVSFPLGPDAHGLITYANDGRMSVVMTAAKRPPLDGDDPLSGDSEQRAAAYSTCLAYAGTYERRSDVVIHHIETSLFPNWSGTVQERSISYRDGQLVLRTLPEPDVSGGTVNELAWARPASTSERMRS